MERWFLIGVIAAVIIVVILSVAALIFQNNPPVVKEPSWDNPQTRALAVRACFDCHSNETRWPWFTKLPGGSWLAVYDTLRGRRDLNFSDWRSGQSRKAREVAEAIREGEMPPGNYLMMHPEAVLTDAEKQQLILGLQNSLR